MNEFEDVKLDVKIKLAALWTSVTLCYLYGDYFELYVPGKLEGMIGGSSLLNNPTKLFFASLLLAIPALMVFLSIVLRPRINGMLNVSLGLFFTMVMVLIGLSSIKPWGAFYVFLAFVESMITSCIVWYAWTWPKLQINK